MEKNSIAITYRPATMRGLSNLHNRTFVFLVRNPQYTFSNFMEDKGVRIKGVTAHSSTGKIRSFRFDRIVSMVPVA
jgi:hypothetical protein|tara:strand:+ start:225 stop:452 length:228 start_codon:yes stop_codon:yes gene_type:complete